MRLSRVCSWCGVGTARVAPYFEHGIRNTSVLRSIDLHPRLDLRLGCIISLLVTVIRDRGRRNSDVTQQYTGVEELPICQAVLIHIRQGRLEIWLGFERVSLKLCIPFFALLVVERRYLTCHRYRRSHV
jgi:hypothetical protein